MLPALLSTSTSGTPAGTSTSRSTGSGSALPPPDPPLQVSSTALVVSAATRSPSLIDPSGSGSRSTGMRSTPAGGGQRQGAGGEEPPRGGGGPGEGGRPPPLGLVGEPVPQHPLGHVGAVDGHLMDP